MKDLLKEKVRVGLIEFLSADKRDMIKRVLWIFVEDVSMHYVEGRINS